MMTGAAADLRRALQARKDTKRAAVMKRFFRAGTGEPAEGDRFLGLTVPTVRGIVRDFHALLPADLEALLRDPLHEVRLAALILLGRLYRTGDNRTRRDIARLYLRSIRHVNHWDLVDLSAPAIPGPELLRTGKAGLLDRLARRNNLWERRIAIVATFAFLRAGRTDETLRIAETLVNDPEDYIHKAVGWLLRETGKHDLRALRNFLNRHAATMPRTMLRYAIEKLSAQERRKWMKKIYE